MRLLRATFLREILEEWLFSFRRLSGEPSEGKYDAQSFTDSMNKEATNMAFKKIRNMKVYEQSGYHYKSTPTIMLKGQWLNELGFGYGTPICVECSGGKLVITRADEIETTFREIGTEPVMCVAESASEYGRRDA